MRPLKLIPWWVKGLVLLAVVSTIAGAGWKVNSWRHRAAEADTAERALADYQQQVSARDETAKADLAREQSRAAQLSADLAAQRSTVAALQAAVQRIPLIATREALPNENGRCDVPVRSPAYRVCRNAAWSGTATDLTACEAYGGDATGGQSLPPAGLVRPRQP